MMSDTTPIHPRVEDSETGRQLADEVRTNLFDIIKILSQAQARITNFTNINRLLSISNIQRFLLAWYYAIDDQSMSSPGFYNLMDIFKVLTSPLCGTREEVTRDRTTVKKALSVCYEKSGRLITIVREEHELYKFMCVLIAYMKVTELSVSL